MLQGLWENTEIERNEGAIIEDNTSKETIQENTGKDNQGRTSQSDSQRGSKTREVRIERRMETEGKEMSTSRQVGEDESSAGKGKKEGRVKTPSKIKDRSILRTSRSENKRRIEEREQQLEKKKAENRELQKHEPP